MSIRKKAKDRNAQIQLGNVIELDGLKGEVVAIWDDGAIEIYVKDNPFPIKIEKEESSRILKSTTRKSTSSKSKKTTGRSK